MVHAPRPRAPELPPWLRLACPECAADLACTPVACRCDRGHRFAVASGIPRLLRSEADAPPAEYVRWIHDYYRVPFSARQRGLSRQRFARFLEFARPETPVLDVGCGRAERSAAFPDGMYVGVDPIDPVAAGMIDVVPAPMIVARGERLPLADAQFGSVMLWAVLDHVADRRALFAECHRVLRPGGALCLMTQVLAQRGGSIADVVRWAVSRLRTGDLRGMLAIARFTYADPRVRAHLTPLTAERTRDEVSSARFTDVRTELVDGHSLFLRAAR